METGTEFGKKWGYSKNKSIFFKSLGLFWYVRNPINKYSIYSFDKNIFDRFLINLDSGIIMIFYCNI